MHEAMLLRVPLTPTLSPAGARVKGGTAPLSRLRERGAVRVYSNNESILKD